MAGLSVMFVLVVVMWAEGQRGLRAAELRSVAGIDAEDSTILSSDHRLARWEPAASLCLGDGDAPHRALFAWLHRRLLRPAA